MGKILGAKWPSKRPVSSLRATRHQAIVGNLNNRIVFNTPDADTAERFSKSLGSEDVNERRESITVGAHETRDGVGFMAHRTERRIVTASQIQCLPQFTGYVVFAYDSPAALVHFEPVDVAPRAPKLVKYAGDGWAVGQMSLPAGETPPPLDPTTKSKVFSELALHEQAREFETWLERFEIADLAAPDVEQVNLAWRYFVLRRLRGASVAEVGQMPVVFGPMMDGSGFEFPEGFKAGPCPLWLFRGNGNTRTSAPPPERDAPPLIRSPEPTKPAPRPKAAKAKAKAKTATAADHKPQKQAQGYPTGADRKALKFRRIDALAASIDPGSRQ